MAAGYRPTIDANLATIARRTGYDGDAPLSKAFKRAYGRSAGSFRRHAAASRIIVEQELAR